MVLTMTVILCPATSPEALSDNARLTSVRQSRTSGLSREQRPRKTEVAHVTCDSDTTFKVKRSKVNLQGQGHIVSATRTACYIRGNHHGNMFPFPSMENPNWTEPDVYRTWTWVFKSTQIPHRTEPLSSKNKNQTFWGFRISTLKMY